MLPFQDNESPRSRVAVPPCCLRDGDRGSGLHKEDEDEGWIQVLPNHQAGAMPIDISHQDGTLDEQGVDPVSSPILS